MSFVVKASSGSLHTTQRLCPPHSSVPVSVSVAGGDYGASDGELPSSPQKGEQCAFASWSLSYENASTVWSNTVKVSLQESSLLQTEKGDRVLVPVYNEQSHLNEAFLAIRACREMQQNVHILIFSPFAVLRNELNRDVCVRMGTETE